MSANIVTIAAVKKLVIHLRASRKAIAQLKTERLGLLRQVSEAEAGMRQLDTDNRQLVDELSKAKSALQDIRDQLRINLREMEAGQ